MVVLIGCGLALAAVALALAPLARGGIVALLSSALALALLSLALAAGLTHAEIRFDAARDYEAADVSSCLGAGAVAAADFNRDRRRDLVVANGFGMGPSVLLNRGRGTFGAPMRIRAGRDACTVAAGDLNGDRRPDIVTASYGENVLRVLLGKGDGRFAVQASYPTGNAPMQVAIADLDRDGDRDLAVVDNYPSEVAIYLGEGNGSFAPAGRTRLGWSEQGLGSGLSIVTGRFDPDRFPDLAVADGGLGVFVLLGKGDGSFEGPALYPVGFDPEYVDAGDLNGDGVADLVTNNSFSNDLSLLFGRGDGTFRPEVRIRKGEQRGISVLDFDDLNGGAGVIISDLDRDGRLDLAATQAIVSGVTVLAGNGRGRFAPVGDYATAGFPEPVLAANLNGDRLPDLVVPGNLPAVPTEPGKLPGDLTTRVSVLLNSSPRSR